MAKSKVVKYMAIVLVSLLINCNSADSASVSSRHHHQRLVRSSDTKAVDVHCSQDTPCGWAVYTRFTRVVDYFMKNTCTCEAGRECIRVDDDVSVSAYVYKCRNVPSSRNGNDRGPAS